MRIKTDNCSTVPKTYTNLRQYTNLPTIIIPYQISKLQEKCGYHMIFVNEITQVSTGYFMTYIQMA
jgi:hypothetical protein